MASVRTCFEALGSSLSWYGQNLLPRATGLPPTSASQVFYIPKLKHSDPVNPRKLDVVKSFIHKMKATQVFKGTTWGEDFVRFIESVHPNELEVALTAFEDQYGLEDLHKLRSAKFICKREFSEFGSAYLELFMNLQPPELLVSQLKLDSFNGDRAAEFKKRLEKAFSSPPAGLDPDIQGLFKEEVI